MIKRSLDYYSNTCHWKIDDMSYFRAAVVHTADTQFTYRFGAGSRWLREEKPSPSIVPFYVLLIISRQNYAVFLIIRCRTTSTYL